MTGANVIFYVFIVILIVLLIRWSVKIFFITPKTVTSEVPELSRRGALSPSAVRRTTVYTISADHRANDRDNNFTDFFWDVSPQTSRQRHDPGKDDKDLPSYEEVMQMEMRQQVLSSAITASPAAHSTPASPALPVTIVPAPVTASTV